MSTRNIGGSLLPSSNPQILEPIQTRLGVLQVRELPRENTHGLFRVSDGALLAKHPNGYTCHALAGRIRDNSNALDQADYIVACGGTVTAAARAALDALSLSGQS